MIQPAPHCPALAHWWQMRASGLLLCWQLQLGMYSVFLFFFFFLFLLVMLPSEVPKLPTDPPLRGLPTVWKLLFHDSLPRSLTLLSLFVFYILSYLLLKQIDCLSGCLVSSTSIQKLFCGSCSASKWSFDEFVGKKVVSPSYFSAILGLLTAFLVVFFVIYSSLPHRNITFSICSCKTVRPFLDPFSFLEMPINCFLINVLTHTENYFLINSQYHMKPGYKY